MPGRQERCPDCSALVCAGHRFTHRCLLNQVARLQTYERPPRGITQSGNLARDLARSASFSNFCQYLRAVARSWQQRPRGALTAPFCPFNTSGANDVALMLAVMQHFAAEAGVTSRTRDGRKRLLAAAVLVSVGFTTAMAVVVGMPPVTWTAEYAQRLRSLLLASRAAQVQVMNCGIQWQASNSFLNSDMATARRKIREILAIMRQLHKRISQASLDVTLPALRMQLSLFLEVPHMPRDGYTMSHGLQLGKLLGVLSKPGGSYVTLVGEKICVGGGLVTALAELFALERSEVQASPVARILLEVLAGQVKERCRCSFDDIYELGVQCCQWAKDDCGDSVGMQGVFAKGLTSSGAAQAGDMYWTKRTLHDLRDAAIAEGRRWKRMRLS